MLRGGGAGRRALAPGARIVPRGIGAGVFVGDDYGHAALPGGVAQWQCQCRFRRRDPSGHCGDPATALVAGGGMDDFGHGPQTPRHCPAAAVGDLLCAGVAPAAGRAFRAGRFPVFLRQPGICGGAVSGSVEQSLRLRGLDGKSLCRPEWRSADFQSAAFPGASTFVRVLSGGLTALAWRWGARRLNPALRGLWLYALATAYLMLFNPMNEENSYVILAPALGAWAVYFCSAMKRAGGGWDGALCSWRCPWSCCRMSSGHWSAMILAIISPCAGFRAWPFSFSRRSFTSVLPRRRRGASPAIPGPLVNAPFCRATGVEGDLI